jgi:hypothetical protein
MNWYPFWVFIAEIGLVSGAMWIACIIGLLVGAWAGRNDIASTYTAAIGVILAWTATSALAIWLVGFKFFMLGAGVFVLVLISPVSSAAGRWKRKPLS